MIEHQVETGPIVGAGQAIAIDGDPPPLDTDVGRAGTEAQTQVLADNLHAHAGEGAAGLIGSHRLTAHHRHLAEAHLRRWVGTGAAAASQQDEIDAEVLFQASLEIEHRLDAVGPQGGASAAASDCRIDAVGFSAAVKQGIDACLDALDIAAAADRLGFECRQQVLVSGVADLAAAAGKGLHPKCGNGLAHQLGGIEVVEEGLDLPLTIAAAAVSHAGIDLQAGLDTQSHLAAGTWIENIAERRDEIEPADATCQLTKGIEVEVEAEVLAEHLADVEVQVEGVAVEAERKTLLAGRKVVVVIDAEPLLNQHLDLRQHRRRIVGNLLELGKNAIDKREGFGERTADYRQPDAVEGLVGQGIAHRLQTQTHTADHLADAEVAEIKGGTQIGHHDSHGIGLEPAGSHQVWQVNLIKRVLLDHPGSTRIQRIEQGDA